MYPGYGTLGAGTATIAEVKVSVYLMEKAQLSTANADYPSSMAVAKLNILERPIRIVYIIH